jgi:hypothetical protein
MLTSSARAADVDWKMYGGATADAQSFCFYDANGVAIAHSGYVRVWTKCLRKADLESVYFKGDRGRQIVDNAAKKVAGVEPKPGDWEQVPPKGKGANLQKILCPK